MAYKTPGVYVEEIPTFPPSVAAVGTAIPAFIGYTAKAEDDFGNAVTTFPYVKRIKDILDYVRFFGKTNPQSFEVQVPNINGSMPESVSLPAAGASKYKMYYAIQMFFANGGGPCYIVSVGKMAATESVTKTDLIDQGLAAARKKDEPTLLLFPDAVAIDGADATARRANYHDVLKAALAQCNDLGDRFLIGDLFDGDSVDTTATDNFRNGVGNNFLKYGAVYQPWLNTTLNYYFENKTVVFKSASATMNNKNLADILAKKLAREQNTISTALDTEVQAETNPRVAKSNALKVAESAILVATAITNAPGSTQPAAGNALTAANTALIALNAVDANAANALATIKSQSTAALTAIGNANTASIITDGIMTNILNNFFTNQFEEKLKSMLSSQYVTLPPSSTVAGVYAMVDSTRGVWKSPANVSLNGVSAPRVKISDKEQESLNVHPSGKSINAIRSFAGQGILVWGARTLASNDNEWRYVAVRRFFNFAEESIKKATEPFVFEPNNANTWVKVRAMIENFLTLQWRAGALAGARPTDAFFVKVGLGQTMTALDILEGRMNVEIGMAVARPAEFIILKFSHKMQES
jgi:hypothetical protein